MINLSYLDCLNEVKIYNALKNYFFVINDSIAKNSKHFQIIYLAIFSIINNSMEDNFYQNSEKSVAGVKSFTYFQNLYL